MSISKDTPLNIIQTQKLYCLLQQKDYMTAFESDCIDFNQWAKDDLGQEIIILFPESINGVKLYAQYGVKYDFVGTEEEIKRGTIKIPDNLPIKDQIEPFLYNEKLYKGGIIRNSSGFQNKHIYIGGVINSSVKEFHPVDIVYKIVSSPAIENPNPPKQLEEKINEVPVNMASKATSYVASITPNKEYENISFENKILLLNGTSSTDVKDALVSINYIDGLGRPIQTVQRGITSSGADLVTHQEYDAFGRQSNTWLPVSIASNNGAFANLAKIKANANTLYPNDNKPYSMPVYEASPLNKVLEQYGPGNAWYAGKKAVRTEYLTNISNNDTLNCILYTVNDSNPLDSTVTITRSKNYDTGQLYVTRVADEDGNTSFEFKDKLGQVVLTRQIIRNGSSKNLHDTYYIYDDFGNLKAVLPPIASDAMKTGPSWSNKGTVSLLRDYAYLYEYDSRNRCIAKRIPGTNWIYYVYDKADQLIFTQDGEQRKKKTGTKSEWIFNKYDAFGRLIISGIYKTVESHEQLATRFGNVVFTEKTGNGEYGYTWDTLKQAELEDANADVLVVNYYDDYETMLKTNSYYKTNLDYNIEPGYGIRHTSAKGLLVGTRVKLINSEGKSVNTIEGQITTAMYYDNRGRLIQTKSNNHLTGGIEKEYLAYNFTGQPIKKLHIHSATGKSNIKEEYAYTYDHAGRLLKTTHQLTERTTVKPQVTLAENTYDELGRYRPIKLIIRQT